MSDRVLDNTDIPYALNAIEANTDRIATALESIASPNETVRAMRDHAAEHDHVLELRLIDVDIFAVWCTTCPSFRKEWKTT